jgi:hypothetical protein
MVGGSWMNPDGLFVQFGTSKAVPTTAGDYLSYGEWRDIEFTLTLSALSATPLIVANTTFFPSNVFVESVQTDVEASPTGASTLSVGTMRTDRSTVISNTAFISAATVGTAGTQTTYTTGVTGVGALVGTTTSFTDNGVYITATGSATPYSTGVVKVRIRYRGIGTITQ